MNPTPRGVSRCSLLVYGAGAFGGVATAATAAVVAGEGGSPDAPAYQAWRHKAKGELGDLQYLALCGSLAPSAHNTQPWKFRLRADAIELHADRSRSLGSADAEQRMMQLSIGCALENVRVAAERLGYRASLQALDADGRFAVDGHCATLKLERAAAREHPWFDAIFERQTTRAAFDAGRPVPYRLRRNLSRAVDDLPGIGLHWFHGPQTVQALGDVVRRSVRGFLTEQRHRDGMRWFRISRAEWEARRDGIAIFAGDAPLVAKRYVEWLADEQDLLSDAFRLGEVDVVDRLIPATPAWGLVYADRASPSQRVQAGRMAERVYLEATAMGHAVHPLSYPTEVPEGAQALRRLAGLDARSEPLFLFRLGTAALKARSVRRDLSEVVVA